MLRRMNGPASPSRRALAATIVLFGCGATKAPEAPETPGLRVQPEWLTFTCVAPGCETEASVELEVIGNRDIAVKRLLLTPENADFEVVEGIEAPAVVAAGTKLPLTVRYRPSAVPLTSEFEVVLTYSDASTDESDPMRIEPGELRVPVILRIWGETTLQFAPDPVNFGYVPVGSVGVVDLDLTHTGRGTLGLRFAGGAADSDELETTDLAGLDLQPGEQTQIQMRYRPTSSSVLDVTFTADTSAGPFPLQVRGTSLPEGRLAVTPAVAELDEIPLNQTRTYRFQLENQGGAPLTVSGLTFEASENALGAEIRAADALDLPITLDTFASAPFVVEVRGDRAGPIGGNLVFDSSAGRTAIAYRGLVTEPMLAVSPDPVEFDGVTEGWSDAQLVTLENTGHGDLTILGAEIVDGSSELFSIGRTATFPIVLSRGQRTSIEVVFRANALASFEGGLGITYEGLQNEFLVIPLRGRGTDCAEACDLANASPVCTNDTCAIGACAPGWRDADGRAETGCECGDRGGPVGNFCGDARDLGSFVDDDNRDLRLSGALEDADDEDVYRFFARDEAFASVAFEVEVALESPDPNVELCVTWKPSGERNPECTFDTEPMCPADRRFIREDGFGTDSAEVLVQVRFRGDGSDQCPGYELFIRNGRR